MSIMPESTTLAFAATLICLINADDWCATHDGRHPATIEVAAGHRVHLCCGKLDDEQHHNFCPQWRLEDERPSVVAPTCPEWCTYPHDQDDSRDDLVLHQGDDHTDGSVRRMLDVPSWHALDIRVSQTDCPSEGTVGTPALLVRADVELTTWEQAAELSRSILDGFGFLQGAGQ